MAEGGGLLNRYRLVKAYRGFESLRLRQIIPPDQSFRVYAAFFRDDFAFFGLSDFTAAPLLTMRPRSLSDALKISR